MDPGKLDFVQIVENYSNAKNMDIEGVVFKKVENHEYVDNLLELYVRSSTELSEITRISAGIETYPTYSGRKGSRSYRNFTAKRDSCEAYLSASENEVYFQKMNARIVFPERYECHIGKNARKPACRFGSFSTRGDSRYSNLIRAIRQKQKCECCHGNDDCFCRDEKHVLLTALARGCAMSREMKKPKALFTDIKELERSVGKTITSNKGGSIAKKYNEEHSGGKNKNGRYGKVNDNTKIGEMKKTNGDVQSTNRRKRNGKDVSEMDQRFRSPRRAQEEETTGKDLVDYGENLVRDSLILPRSHIIGEFSAPKETKLKFLFPEKIIENDVSDKKELPKEVAVCDCGHEKHVRTSKESLDFRRKIETDVESVIEETDFDRKTDQLIDKSKCFSVDKNEIIPILDKFIEEIERLKLKCHCQPRRVCFMQSFGTQTNEFNIFSEHPVSCYPIQLQDPNPFKIELSKHRDKQNGDNEHIYQYLSIKKRQMELLENPFVLHFDRHDEDCLKEAFFRFSSQSCS